MKLKVEATVKLKVEVKAKVEVEMTVKAKVERVVKDVDPMTDPLVMVDSVDLELVVMADLEVGNKCRQGTDVVTEVDL